MVRDIYLPKISIVMLAETDPLKTHWLQSQQKEGRTELKVKLLIHREWLYNNYIPTGFVVIVVSQVEKSFL